MKPKSLPKVCSNGRIQVRVGRTGEVGPPTKTGREAHGWEGQASMDSAGLRSVRSRAIFSDATEWPFV